MPGMDPNL